jgi:predicted DNA-binding transcriptional regulator AlpA
VQLHQQPKSDYRGYLDEAGAAAYVGYSRDQFKRLVKQLIFPKPIFLTPNAKGLWSIRALDAAIDRATRSRKPRREVRGVFRERLELERNLERTTEPAERERLQAALEQFDREQKQKRKQRHQS